MSNSVIMDSFIFFYMWLTAIVGTSGDILCDYSVPSSGIIINHSVSLSVKNFTDYMRERRIQIGKVEADVIIYSGQ